MLLKNNRLGDRDDDVRAVAATSLLPVAQHIVEQIPESLDQILIVLWHCLSDMKDDLNSSVGAVMDFLGQSISIPSLSGTNPRHQANL